MSLTLIHVAAGGALGAVARHLTGQAALGAFGPGFPWGTLAVNVIGSAAMGMLVVLLDATGAWRAAPFLLTGLLGGFTTFSAFSLDAARLWERGEPALAALYAGGSVALSLAAIALGLLLTRAVLA